MTIHEAHQKLEAALMRAKNAPELALGVHAQLNHRAWIELTELSEKVLSSRPHDPVALACLAEVEFAHGHKEFAVTYLKYATEAMAQQTIKQRHDSMKAVILAGGLGTRISEESTVRPKPMVQIGGMPILWHLMKVYFRPRHQRICDLLWLQGLHHQRVLCQLLPAHVGTSRSTCKTTTWKCTNAKPSLGR